MRPNNRRAFRAALLGSMVGVAGGVSAQTVSDKAVAFDLDVPLAALMMSTPAPPSTATTEQFLSHRRDLWDLRREFRAPRRSTRVPDDWSWFESRFGPVQYTNQPHLQWIEDRVYDVNQSLYSLKLFQQKVNALLSLEYSLRDIGGGYDSRSRQNRIDSFFDHAKVKTDFDWEAPVDLYVGVRFEIKCDSLFQFWK